MLSTIGRSTSILPHWDSNRLPPRGFRRRRFGHTVPEVNGGAVPDFSEPALLPCIVPTRVTPAPSLPPILNPPSSPSLVSPPLIPSEALSLLTRKKSLPTIRIWAPLTPFLTKIFRVAKGYARRLRMGSSPRGVQG